MTRSRSLLWAFAVAAACSDAPTAPPTRELTLSRCEPGRWMAYRNDGGSWVALGDDVGDFTIQGTERITVATAILDPVRPHLNLYHFSASQAEQFFSCPGAPPAGPETRSLSGTVLGVPAGILAQVSVGSSLAIIPGPGFTMNVPTGTRDLMAVRSTSLANQRADRIIIRRAQAHQSGVIAALDFEGTEAVLPAEHVLRWVGPLTNVRVSWRGADGNVHIMASKNVGAPTDGSVPQSTALHSVPAHLQVAGELHFIELAALDGRTVSQYYAQPGDRTLSFGPYASTPAFTTVATSPTLRLKVDVASQAEYGGYLALLLSQKDAQYVGPSVFILATREHFGRLPRTWSFTMPEVGGLGVEEWPGFSAGTPVGWEMELYSRPWERSPAAPVAGDLARSARLVGVQ